MRKLAPTVTITHFLPGKKATKNTAGRFAKNTGNGFQINKELRQEKDTARSGNEKDSYKFAHASWKEDTRFNMKNLNRKWWRWPPIPAWLVTMRAVKPE
jgi:hypothetical protein